MALNKQLPCYGEDHLAWKGIWILGAENNLGLIANKQVEPESYSLKEQNPAKNLNKLLRERCFRKEAQNGRHLDFNLLRS